MSETELRVAAPGTLRQEQGLRFVRRMYLPRTVGLGLGGVCIASVLWANGAPAAAWAALALSTLGWPHLAYRLGGRSRDPYRAELRSLMIDSALGGAWIAAMKFNLLPSVLLFAMLSMDKLTVGGVKFLARCAAAMTAACAGAALLLGFELRPHTGMLQIAGSLPLLVVYPMAVGLTAYRLARRVRDQNQLLAELSRTDTLTRLLNRGYWEQAVAAEFQRVRRGAGPSSLLMLDIDHFKAVNDRHGHPVGDEVIRSVAAVLSGSVRQHDVPGRYGGEEFGVLLPDTPGAAAALVAERVRKRIESSVLARGAGVRSTVSIGIAELEPANVDYGEWVAHADRALYEAKALGRNRCVRYGEASSAAVP